MHYRKIYEQHYGPIPKDSEGRTYDIHHKDGNRKNNDITNLQCVSIQEHYDIHYSQGDWAACQNILLRMNVSPEEISKKCRFLLLERVKNGTHHFCGENNPMKIASKNDTHPFKGINPQQKLIDLGIHPFQNKEKQKERSIKNNTERVKNGTHNFLGKNSPVHKQLLEGTHNSQFKWTCNNCNKIGKGKGNFTIHKRKCKDANV